MVWSPEIFASVSFQKSARSRLSTFFSRAESIPSDLAIRYLPDSAVEHNLWHLLIIQ